MNVAGIGVDIVEIERFKKAIDSGKENFLKKIFTQKEIDAAKDKGNYSAHMAGKFAAKEAIKKALPSGAKVGFSWTSIEILNDEDGKPYAVLHGRAKELKERFDLREVLVSISHTESIAVSSALGVKNGA